MLQTCTQKDKDLERLISWYDHSLCCIQGLRDCTVPHKSVQIEASFVG